MLEFEQDINIFICKYEVRRSYIISDIFINIENVDIISNMTIVVVIITNISATFD